jgi:carbon monoxide dehydrogenase subunit G
MPINVRLAQNPSNRIGLDTTKNEKVRVLVGGSGSGGASYLDNLLDVNSTDKDNGETVVWDDIQGKYVIKPIPEIDGGTF